MTLTEKLNLHEFTMAIPPVHWSCFVLAIIVVGSSYYNLTNMLLVESYYFRSQNNVLHKRQRYFTCVLLRPIYIDAQLTSKTTVIYRRQTYYY